jgi:hypothetical protein
MKTIKKISDQKGKHDLQTLTQKQMSMVFGGDSGKLLKNGSWIQEIGNAVYCVEPD